MTPAIPITAASPAPAAEPPPPAAARDRRRRLRLTRRAVTAWAAPFATVVGAAAGCVPSGGAQPSPGSGAAPEVQLRYLAWLKEWGETVPQLASRLREQHRVVLDVELAAVGVTPWQEKLQALFAADAAPDALQGRANVDPLFQDGGLFLDLAARVQRDKIKIDAATYALSGTERWCGKIYSVPHWADPNAVFYNKSLLRQVGAIRKETGLEPFQAGRVAFQVRAVTDVVRNLKAIGNSFEWDVIHLPKAADGKPGLALAAGHGQVAAARTAHPDRAWDVLKFLIAPEAQDVWAQVNMPALRSAFGAHLKAPPAHAQVFGDLYARGYGIHFRHHNTAQAWDLYAEEGRKVIEGQASLGPGLTELNRRMNDLVRFGSCAPYAGLRHPIRP